MYLYKKSAIELAVAGNAGIIATNNLKDFRSPKVQAERSPELVFPNVSILEPE